MKFRPCIDIHNGKVKQIVGKSLDEAKEHVTENFVSKLSPKDYALKYQKDGLTGGHIILLNAKDSGYAIENENIAKEALKTYPGGLQIGGGIDDTNAVEYLTAGASHVIVTSYVFRNGVIQWDNIKRLSKIAGKEHLVLDLSCRRYEEAYYIMTDRWQKFTKVTLTMEVLSSLSKYCNEFLIHAVDVEGCAKGIETKLVQILEDWNETPVTYAGGISKEGDIELLSEISKNRMDFTIGSALDLFGGNIRYQTMVQKYSC